MTTAEQPVLLETGDRLSREEFHRRYELRPDADGMIESSVFPTLRLDVDGMLAAIGVPL